MDGKQTPEQAQEFVNTIKAFLDAVSGLDLNKIKSLTETVQSLQFDNERIVKPALADIREILSRDIYAPKTDITELRAEIKELKDELAKEKERTRNYGLVEKVVFGLVAIVLMTVAGAIVALVVVTGGGRQYV